MKKRVSIFVIIALFGAVLLSGCLQANENPTSVETPQVAESESTENPQPQEQREEIAFDDAAVHIEDESPENLIDESVLFRSNLVVHFLDVGQADATLIQLPNEQTMLIDGGNSRDADSILSYMRSLGITTIDYLVATHPHADHIGGLPNIISEMNIGEVYMPQVSHTTQTFERLLDAIENKGLQINSARAGVSILSVPGLSVDIVAPVRDDYENLNDWSAIILLTYSNTSFLFTGDAEALSEGHITADISADVLKVGHHGSSTSTSQGFLDRVAPTYGIISAGAGNSYGHPTDAVLSRLDNANVSIFRTDLQGTIVFTSDGILITISAEPIPFQPNASTPSPTQQPTPQPTPTPQPQEEDDDTIVFITATGARYHLDGCRHLAQSRIETTLSAAIAQGLSACGTCRPPN